MFKVSKISPSKSISSASDMRERSSSSGNSLDPEHSSGSSVALKKHTIALAKKHCKRFMKWQRCIGSVSVLTRPHRCCGGCPASFGHGVCRGACVLADVAETKKRNVQYCEHYTLKNKDAFQCQKICVVTNKGASKGSTMPTLLVP